MKSLSSMVLTTMIAACVACGTKDTYQKPSEPVLVEKAPAIDQELKPYVAMFMHDCEARRTDCKTRLSKILEIRAVNIPDFNEKDNEVVIGLCYDGFLYKRVEINKAIIHYHVKYLQTLIYHELGHCMYDLEHENKTDTIMSPVMPDITILIKEWEALLLDFFATIEERNGP